MIQLQNVSKVFDETTAVDDISFHVEEGETFGLIGTSGCGKTTTLKMINRLIEPSAGSILINGQVSTSQNPEALRHKMGYVIQNVGLFPHYTVQENVAIVPKLLKWEEQRIASRSKELLEVVGLNPETFADRKPDSLSGGQQQRVGLARALAADPPIILMDEPFGALDPITRDNLQDEFLEIQDRINTTILFVTHSIDEALKMGDRIAIFDVGEIVQYDTPTEILKNPKNEFVENFIGDNRTFKQLAITTVEEVMDSKEGQPPSDSNVVSAATDGGDDQAIPADASLQVALTKLLGSEDPTLPVVRDGRIVGTVSEQHIRSYFGPTEES
jgi:osmoprotectant transport system ATP-binding protein